MENFDFEIRTPEWGAGTTYQWDTEKYGMRGIGIATYRFNGRSALKIKSKNTIYRITKAQVDEFLREYPNSKHYARGVKLWVVPMSIMKIIKEIPVKASIKFSEPAVLPKQQLLF